MSGNSKDNKEVTTSFTVDAEDIGNEMPNVTRLLNRKSFKKTDTSQPNPAPAAAAPTPPPLPSEPVAGPAPGLPKPAKRRSGAAPRPLHVWTPTSLREGTDPLGQALASLLDSGADQALFLAIQPLPGKLPVFVATAAVNAASKQAIWAGLCWDPAVLPGIWSQLVSAGLVELPPPGTMTNLHSERNVSRAAFDVLPEEALYIARVGTPQQCRGIIALVSKKSLTAAIKQAAPLLNAAPPASMKKPA